MRRISIVTNLLCCLILVGSAGADDRALSDWQCESPENITGIVHYSSGEGPFTQAWTWDGEAYAVVVGKRDADPQPYDLYFVRVAADGTILRGPVAIYTTPTWYELIFDIVWNGTDYAILWADTRKGLSAQDLWFARIDANGAVIAGTENRITDLTNSYVFDASLSWTGTQYGVAWSDNRAVYADIFFVRLDATGAVIAGSELTVASGITRQEKPQIVWNAEDDEWAIVWQDDNGMFDYDIYCGFIYGDGTLSLWGGGLILNPYDDFIGDLTWNGSLYALASINDNSLVLLNEFDHHGDIQVGRMVNDTFMGIALDANMTWTGAEYGVTWWLIPDGYSYRQLLFQRMEHPADRIGNTEILQTTFSDCDVESGALEFAELGYGYSFQTDTRIDFIGIGCHGDTTPPSCPEGAGECGRTDTTITLCWGPANDLESDISHYVIYKNGSEQAITTETSWTDDAFDPAAGSHYLIQAVNALGLTSVACAVIDTTDREQPTCPGGLQAINLQPNSVTIGWTPAWDALSGVKEYRIYRDAMSIGTVPANGILTFLDTTAIADTTYAYLVESVDFSGNNNSSCDVLWVSTAPISLTMTKNADSINANLIWTNVSLPQYRVYRSTNPQSFSELKRSTTNETTDPVLQDSVKIWFYYIQNRE